MQTGIWQRTTINYRNHDKCAIERYSMSSCEECDAEIPVPADALEGEIVTCPECGASFELATGKEDFDLRPAQTVGEDWGQ